jgi:UDP-glucose 4-epimerase
MARDRVPRSKMKYFITGVAGFIGSNLADHLLDEGHEVVGWDNFSTGRERFVENACRYSRYQLIKGDNLNLRGLKSAMKGCEQVFHFAANADVRFGLEHPSKDIQQNTLATFHVLEAMRSNGIRTIVFASTGSVYGEASVIPTPEDAPFPIQTSLYGASKLAGEALIEAYCEGYGFRGLIFRLVSILGERYAHGHIFDFYRQLLTHPDRLEVLGDGNQRKSYLYVGDCIAAVLHAMRLPSHAGNDGRSEIYNLGTTDYCRVVDSIDWISGELGLAPKICFTGGRQGWIGDNPFIFLDTTKIRKTGWDAKVTIREGVVRTLRWLRENRWVFHL